MKTYRNTFALALAVITLASIRLEAGDVTLSPRARQNQMVRSPGTTVDHLNRGFLGIPRNEANKTRISTGKTEDRLNRSTQMFSPRALQNFPWLVESATIRVRSDHQAKLPVAKHP